ncbi:MAG: hypothetical protein ABSE20_22445 [Acetobacteraceae bacterium]|jgi:hypothetical protein
MSLSVIQGVTVIGDVIRPDGRGQPGGVDRATIWLFDAIKRQVHLATDLPIDVITANGSPTLRSWLDALRSPATAHQYWAGAYDVLPQSADPEAVLASRLGHRFCIGYELPPWLRKLLQEIDVPYIDLRLHPVRFLDDLLFAVRASEPATQTALLTMAEAESEVIVTAGLREAMCHMISEATVPSNTLLVVGQRPLDCSQIIDGAFYDALPHAAEIHAICAHYAAVLLKPHPLEPSHSLLEIAAGASNVAGVVQDNSYRLMSLPQISAVLTVNSSIAFEAPYFGKRVHTLAPLPIRLGWCGTADGPNLYASLNDRVLSVDFWRQVLAPHTSVSEPDGMRLPPKPNRLRIALDSFWNFQEIDTDRIPGRPGS